MSLAAAKPKRKSKGRDKPRRFNQATRRERRVKVEPPSLTSDHSLMSQWLPLAVLNDLARRWNAGDVRQRNLTVTVVFWMTVLAVGPGGPLSLHQVLTYARVAGGMSGLGASHATLSKEAIRENFRERP